MDYLTIINYIGIAAAILTTIAWVPQTVKTLKTKSTKDISFKMMLIMNIGILLWLVHGIAVHSIPLILANGITFPLALSVLIYKIKYG